MSNPSGYPPTEPEAPPSVPRERRVWAIWDDVPEATLAQLLAKHGWQLMGRSTVVNAALRAAPEWEVGVVIWNCLTPSTEFERPTDALIALRKLRSDVRVVLLVGDPQDPLAAQWRQAGLMMSCFDWVEGVDDITDALLERLEHPRQLEDVLSQLDPAPRAEVSSLQWEGDSEDPPSPAEPPPPGHAPGLSGPIDRMKSAGSSLEFVHTARTLVRPLVDWRRGLWPRNVTDDLEEDPDAVPERSTPPKPPKPPKPSGRRKAAQTAAVVVRKRFAVLGVQGGVGVTTATALLAWAWIKMGIRVGVLEAASPGGFLLPYFGLGLVDQGWEAGHAPESIARHAHKAQNLSIIPRGVGAGALAQPPAVGTYADWLYQHSDLLVVDGGQEWCGGGGNRDALWRLADAIVLMAIPTAVGFQATIRVVDLIHTVAPGRLAGLILAQRTSRRLSRQEWEHEFGCDVLWEPSWLPERYGAWADRGRPPAELVAEALPLAQRLIVHPQQRITVTLD